MHCNLIGHTIVGDYTYSGRKDVDPDRMFLHSHRLILPSRIENLDVSAGDLLEESGGQFTPFIRLNSLDVSSYAKLDSQPADLNLY